MATADTPKNYILVGDDHNGAFREAVAIYERDPEHNVIIQAKPGQSVEDAVKEIKGPANIILESHGGKDGTFTWNKGEIVPYEKMLAALPRQGVESITLGSCYGGTAERDDILRAAPEGAVVQSSVGAGNEGISTSIARLAETAHRGGSSTQIFMESLAAFDAKEYKAAIENDNRTNNKQEDSNPEHALPHMLGVGGRPPTLINLDQTVSQMVHPEQPLDAAAFNRAVQETHTVFEHSARGPNSTVAGDDQLIDRVAQKMQAHVEPQGAEEKRVAFAITAAYMEQAGALQHWVDVAKHQDHGKTPPAMPQSQTQTHNDYQQFSVPRAHQTPAHNDRTQETLHLIPQNGMPDLAALKQEVFGDHKLVTASHQNSAETRALEAFAKTMHVQGVRTDAPQLSDAEIKKIQAALHVKEDGKVGEKTLHALMHAEEVRALPTPGNGAPVAAKGQAH